MTIHPTLELGNPLLRRPAQPVAAIDDPALHTLIADLWETLDDFRARNGWGHALAAPVIGVDQRVIVMDYEGRRIVLINPRFESWSRDQVIEYESCITFAAIYGAVSRPAQVVVVALDADGREQRYDVRGSLSRMMQHEIDHLDGLVWLDRDPDLSSICTRNEYLRQLEEHGSLDQDTFDR